MAMNGDTLFIPESKRINEVFKEMQKNKIHMAIVVDEYGGTAVKATTGIRIGREVKEEKISKTKSKYIIKPP